jgi:glycosyltransferase involved in cell wall biosynthesis
MRDGIMSSEAGPTRGTGVSQRKRLTICAIGEADSVHVATRIRCFADMGHRVYLITPSTSRHGIAGVTELVPGFDSALADRGWRGTLARGCRRIGGETLCHVFRIVGFVRLLLRCRPDIVHVHYAYSLYGWAAGLLGCRPLVVTVMGGDVLFEEQGSPTPIGKWLTLELLRKADYITSKSHHLTEILDGFGGFADKTERILWGVPVETFCRVDASSLRQRLGIAAQRRVILSPKILRPLYRVDLVVEAMALVRESCPDAILLLTEYMPDADYRTAINRRIDELGLAEHVLFCGQVDHAEMPAYYSLAEICVAVPSSDGLPQTLFESMACGTPNILSRLPRYEEIVRHEESAYFVEPNPADIAEGILRLLTDSPLHRRISDRAREIVCAEANLAEQAARVERRYQELAATIRLAVTRPAALLAAWRSYRQGRGSRAATPAVARLPS